MQHEVLANNFPNNSLIKMTSGLLLVTSSYFSFIELSGPFSNVDFSWSLETLLPLESMTIYAVDFSTA